MKVVTLALLLFVSLCQFAEARDEMAEFWAKYKELAEKNDYGAAWTLLEQGHGKADANIHLTKGHQLLVGWGIERDKCRAALEFEEARRKGSTYALTFLQYIYNGAWLQISAEEGNRDALFELAEAAWGAYKIGNAMTPFSKLLALKEVYRLYKRAELAGHVRGMGQALILQSFIRSEGGLPTPVDPDFKRVICDVRARK